MSVLRNHGNRPDAFESVYRLLAPPALSHIIPVCSVDDQRDFDHPMLIDRNEELELDRMPVPVGAYGRRDRGACRRQLPLAASTGARLSVAPAMTL